MRWLFVPVMALALPATSSGDTPAEPGCPVGTGLMLVEAGGMGWAPAGLEPGALAGLDRSAIVGWARAWAVAYRAAGVDRVVLAPLAAEVSSWGAVEKVKPTPGKPFGRFDFFVLDAIVEAFDGDAVLVVSARAAWDHAAGEAPKDRAAFKEYARALMERYDGGDTSFGVADNDDSYPDIDGSGKVTSADFEASSEAKLAWARAHRVAAFQVETELLQPGGRDDYAKVFGDVMAVAEGVDVPIWLAPFPATIPQADFAARVAPLVGAGEDAPDAIVVSVAGAGADPTVAGALDAVRKLLKSLANTGYSGDLLVGGASFGWRAGAGGCEERCDEAMQAEQAAKLIAGSAASGAKGLLYDGVLEKADDPTGAGLAAIDAGVAGATPRRRPALAVARIVARALGPKSAETATKVASTHAVRSATCTGEEAAVVWYDWTLEVGPGQPYQDLVKRVSIDLPFDSVRSALLGPGTAFEPAKVEAAGGKADVTLGRTPVLLVSRQGGWPPPDSEPADGAQADGAGEDAAPGGDGTGGSGGGGCGAPGAAAWPALLAAAAAAFAVSRRRRTFSS